MNAIETHGARALNVMHAQAARAATALLEFALPERCPGCGDPAAPERMLCDACRGAIPRLAYAVCVRCLRRGRSPVGCNSHASFEAWPAWIYEERCAALVQAFKFAERTALAATLAEELVRVTPPVRFDFVLAVPLHSARQRERGYNQAALLADALSERIGVPRLDGALARRRATPAQSLRGAGERRRNLDGAFEVTRPAWLQGRRVLLVDDVVTTGATLEACMQSLHDAGAKTSALALAWAQ